MRVQRQIRTHRLCTAPLRSPIPRCHNRGIGRRCRGRWLSSNRSFSRNVVHSAGEKTQSAEPTPCRGRIFPAVGDDRRVLRWFWCSPPLRWTRKQPRSLPRPARIKCALGRRGQRQHREHDLRPLRAVRVKYPRWPSLAAGERANLIGLELLDAKSGSPSLVEARRCCMTPTTSKESASYVFGTKSEISMESVTYQYLCNNAASPGQLDPPTTLAPASPSTSELHSFSSSYLLSPGGSFLFIASFNNRRS